MTQERKNQLQLTDYLTAERIIFLHGRQKKDAVLNALIDVLAEVPEIGTRDDIAWGIFHRESLMNTSVGNSIAAPHFRLDSIDDSYAAAAIVPDGIVDYQAPDQQPVRLVFMIIDGKQQKMLHVKLLTSITKAFFDGRLKAAFLASNDPNTCMDILRRAEQ